ncbi:MAG: Rrf2 family transcriptional regulator [Bacteroidetes bacterium]|nr:Rrf2 family transcriptional regulator [Bacteroidota bacterium]
MLLSKTSEYGIRAMLHLAGIGGDEYVPVKKISQTLNISFHFLTKIFQQLARAGLISSYRGPNGGVRLEIDASKITVKAVVVALDGPDLFTQCVLGLPGCTEDRPCPLHSHWITSRKEIETMLGQKTLAEIGSDLRSGGYRLTAGAEWTDA